MDATAIIRLALVVISDRLITILALLTSCGLACWAMWGMGWERVTILAIYVIFSYLTVRTKEKPSEEQRTST
jgi:fatty acid desaturase